MSTLSLLQVFPAIETFGLPQAGCAEARVPRQVRVGMHWLRRCPDGYQDTGLRTRDALLDTRDRHRFRCVKCRAHCYPSVRCRDANSRRHCSTLVIHRAVSITLRKDISRESGTSFSCPFLRKLLLGVADIMRES